jgi:hypothetical protein
VLRRGKGEGIAAQRLSATFVPAFPKVLGPDSTAFRAFRDAIRKTLAFRVASRRVPHFATHATCCEDKASIFAFWEFLLSCRTLIRVANAIRKE